MMTSGEGCTSISSTAGERTLQYSYGDQRDPDGPKTLLITFDAGDIFVRASTVNVPFPRCWVK